jgi:hypothetical protein
MLAMTVFLPFLVDQRSGLTVATWIDPTTGLTIARLAYRFFVNWSFGALIALGVVGFFRRKWRPAEKIGLLHTFAPLLSLFLFPVLIAAFSLAVQPTLYERYIIVVVAPVAVLIARAALPAEGKTGALFAGAVSVAMVAALGLEMRRYNALTAITDWRIHNAIVTTDRIVARGGPFPVLFARRFEQYPLIQLRPDLASSTALVDFDGNPPDLLRRTVFERDMARRIASFYPQYRLFNVDARRPASPLFLITSSNEEDEARRLLKNFQVVTEAPDVYLVEVPAPGQSSGRDRRFVSAPPIE